jgi:uncharacterized protein YbjQ (UPF0145 family)
MVTLVMVWIFKEMDITSDIGNVIAVILLVIAVVGTFLIHHPIHKKKIKEPIDSISPEELSLLKNIQLFNVLNIDKKYTALGMIEAYDTDKIKAKEKLQLQAHTLGADAVINVVTNIDNNVTGSVGSLAGMPRMVSGKTSTTTTYHYEGTAVKLFTKA